MQPHIARNRCSQPEVYASHRRVRARPACVGLAVLLIGCAFDGYVPADPPRKPLAATELDVADLSPGGSVKGDLDCPAGRCRVRYRIIAPADGELVVTVDGPAGEGDQGDVGPRLARAVLEGVAHQPLATRARTEGAPPFEVRSAVQRGIHYVLVQGLGGPLDYEVSATFTPTTASVHEPDTQLAMPDEPAKRTRYRQPVERTVVPLPRNARGDLSDGADYGADPNVKVGPMRKYAFAQDPAKMLQGKPGSVHGNVFLLRQIQRQIQYWMLDQGRTQVPIDEADFLVAVGVGSKSTTWWSLNVPGFTQGYDYYFNEWYQAGLGVRPHTYQDGTLMIDILDAETGRLVWHGWTVEPIPISGDENALLKKAVGNVLNQI